MHVAGNGLGVAIVLVRSLLAGFRVRPNAGALCARHCTGGD